MSSTDAPRIAIHPDLVRLPGGEEVSLSRRWIDLAERAEVHVRLVDALAEDALEAIRPCDGFMWHFAADRRAAPAAKRLLLALEQGMALPSYPDWRGAWPFDDSAAQAATLDAAGMPTPQTWIFWTEGDALDFCRDAPFPLRVRGVDGGERLVHDRREAVEAARRAFSDEANARGSLLRKVWWGGGDRRDRHEGGGVARECFVLQEELPPGIETIRLLVIGERAFALEGIAPLKVDERLVALAFEVAARLRAQSLVVDMALHAGTPVVTGMSYAPAVFPQRPSGHWQRADMAWHADTLRPQDAVFESFIARVRAHRGEVDVPAAARL